MRPLAPTVGLLATAVLALAACSSGSDDDAGTNAGAGQEPDRDAAIVVGSLTEPVNLDNIAGGGQGVTEALHGNVYESLFKLTDDGQVEDLLAASTDVSDDGLTYTFELREATFHSGAVLSADDVVWSIERVISEESQSARKSQLEPVIDKVRAVDDATVEISLTKPSATLTYNLSYVWIVPDGADDLQNQTDGTGPYRLGEWRSGSALTLEVFADYWGDPPANGGVTFRYFQDSAALNNALIAGDLDVVTGLSDPDSLAAYENNPEFTIVEGLSTTKELLAFNDRVEPFNDARVRKAVTSAIDHAGLLDAIWAGRGELIGSMSPPTDPWYEDLTGVNPYDPELARDLLTEAGYPDGFTFTLVTPNNYSHPQVAEFVKSSLAEVGITVEIDTIVPSDWYTIVFENRDFEATLQEHVNHYDITWYGDPDFYWGYDNADVQEWVAQSDQGTEQERVELLGQVNRQIAEDAASDWLFLWPQIRVSRANVTGYLENGLNSIFYVSGIQRTEG